MIDVIAVGALGKLSPNDDAYQKWTEGKAGSSLNFLNLRSRLSKVCVEPEVRAPFKQDGWGFRPYTKSFVASFRTPRTERSGEATARSTSGEAFIEW